MLRSVRRLPLLWLALMAGALAVVWGGLQVPVAQAAPDPVYLRISPVAGTDSGGEVTLRVKLWNSSDWTELAAQDVTVTIGANSGTVTTDAIGEGTVRLPWSVGQTATAQFAGDALYAAATASTDFSTFGKPQGDFIFLVDESGTMTGVQAGVRNNIVTIANSLAASLDYHIGLIGFGSSITVPHIMIPATPSTTDFAAAANQLTISGWSEPSIDAVTFALGSRVGTRPDGGVCIVLLGDEPPQSQIDLATSFATAEQALQARGAVLFPVVAARDANTVVSGYSYTSLATASGGTVFDIAAFALNPADLLVALGSACSTSILSRPDIAVTVTDAVADDAPGGTRTYTVEVRNDGAVTATGVQVDLTLSGPQTVTAVDQGGTLVSPLAARWTIPSLAVSAATTFTATALTATTAVSGDLVDASATVADDGANGLDLTPANNTAIDTTVVQSGQRVLVRYADDDLAGALVTPLPGTRVLITGQPGDSVGFSVAEAQAGVPAGYDYVSVDNVTTFDNDLTVDQVIVVHLSHHRTTTTLPTTRTVIYVGAGALTPPTVVQTRQWSVDTDHVLGVTTYASSVGHAEVPSPAVAGHTVDIARVLVTAAEPGTTIAPQNETVTVTYRPVLPTTGADTPVSALAGAAGMFILAGVCLIMSDRRREIGE